MNPVGKPDAGKPHVRFDERGRETWPCWPTRPSSTLLTSSRLTGAIAKGPRAKGSPRDHRLRWSLLPQARGLWSSVKFTRHQRCANIADVSFGHPDDEIISSDRKTAKDNALCCLAGNDLMNEVGKGLQNE